MAKNRKKKKKKRGGGPEIAEQGAESEGSEATAPPPAAASLGIRPSVRRKVEKVSRKQEAALAKKAARAKWGDRMTAEGR